MLTYICLFLTSFFKIWSSSPVLKKDLLKKENCPMSPLPHISKVFERWQIYKQIKNYIKNNFIIGFRKSHRTQHFLATRPWNVFKNSLDKGEFVSVIFVDLSKAFDTINHNFLLPKLNAHGFSDKALNLGCSNLKDRKQTVQINNNFSSERSADRYSTRLYWWPTII